MPDSKLDLSGIPESTAAELRRARKFGCPASGNAKQLIAIRIAPQLLRQLRRMAATQSKPCQTLIHELLEKSARTRSGDLEVAILSSPPSLGPHGVLAIPCRPKPHFIQSVTV